MVFRRPLPAAAGQGILACFWAAVCLMGWGSVAGGHVWPILAVLPWGLMEVQIDSKELQSCQVFVGRSLLIQVPGGSVQVVDILEVISVVT